MTGMRSRLPVVVALFLCGSIFVCGALPGAPSLGTVCAQEIHPNAFRFRMKTVRSENTKSMIAHARWCEREDFPAEALEWRLRALTMSPDDAKARKKLGFVKDDDGAWGWDPTRRIETIEALQEPPDGSHSAYGKRVESLRRRIAGRYAEVAAVAATQRALADESLQEQWDEIRAGIWDAALRFDPTDQGALEARGHPYVDERFVHTEAKPFLATRAERVARGKRNWAAPVEFGRRATDAESRRATWQRAQGAGLTVDSSLGIDAAREILQSGARASWEALDTLGLGRARASELTPSHFLSARDKDEMTKLLRQYSDWTELKISEHIEHWGSAWLDGYRVISRDDDVAEAADVLMANRVASVILLLRRDARSAGERQKKEQVKLQKWISEAFKIDVLMRLKGSVLAKFAETGTYAAEEREFARGDTWMRRAHRFHDLGLLPPLRNLLSRDLNRLDSLHTSLGYAFLVYLLERDEKAASRFVRNAVHVGTEPALRAVYDTSLDEIEPQFQRWLEVAR